MFAARRGRELSVGELNRMMLEAQESTYGDGLAKDDRHPYMWAVKGHYYSPGRSFYNFPYLFGLLFGLGLFANYQAKPEGFRSDTTRCWRRPGGPAPPTWRRGSASISATGLLASEPGRGADRYRPLRRPGRRLSRWPRVVDRNRWAGGSGRRRRRPYSTSRRKPSSRCRWRP